MSTNSLQAEDQQPSQPEDMSLRFAIDMPTTGWTRVSISRGKKLLYDDGSVPELANQVMRFAVVYVRVKGRKVVEITTIGLNPLKMDADGRVDRDAVRRKIIERNNGMYAGEDSTPSVADAEAIKRCIGLGSREP